MEGPPKPKAMRGNGATSAIQSAVAAVPLLLTKPITHDAICWNAHARLDL